MGWLGILWPLKTSSDFLHVKKANRPLQETQYRIILVMEGLGQILRLIPRTRYSADTSTGSTDAAFSLVSTWGVDDMRSNYYKDNHNEYRRKTASSGKQG